MSDANFHVVKRPHGECWLHKFKPVWIVHYPLPNGRAAEFYQAYRPAAYIGEHDLKGRDPWTVDNRRVGSEHGYPTLEAAMEAAERVTL